MKKVRKKRPRCKTCSLHLQAWGYTTLGKRRYRCFKCGKSRLYTCKRTNQSSFFQLFKQYVLWGITYEMLVQLSGYSVRYLEKKFHEYLKSSAPEIVLPELVSPAYLLIDGLWFGRWFVLMVYRRAKNLTILHISVAGREVESKISRDLNHLRETGYRFSGIISDGGTGIISAIKTVYPHTPHQVCLAHIHRQITASIGRYPKDTRVSVLRKLADHIWFIESQEALRWWIRQIQEWKQKNIFYLLEMRRDDIGRSWYVHKGVRKALRLMFKLPSISFTFLRHPLMPKTTNELEAQFGHLAKRWLSHRGLKKERWQPFMKWFVYFYNQKKLTDRKKKKD